MHNRILWISCVTDLCFANWYLKWPKYLTLSCLGPPLDRHLALAIHISPNNGPVDMIPCAKLVVDVLAVHWTL
jgi:hypothetical protein